jgi:peptidyl-prolyl cis-trans isomerase SDCCAG10
LGCHRFFVTLDRADALQNKHTIFATVRGDTYFNVVAISESELQPDTDKPVYPTIIKSIEIDDNPFPDIVPRITAEEKRTQEKARREARKNAAGRSRKKEGTKNKSLISFDDEEEGADSGPKVKIGSAHDALNDPSLSKAIKSRRELPGEMPEEFGQLPPRDPVKPGGSKRKAEEMDSDAKAGSSMPNMWDSAAFSTRIESSDRKNGTDSSSKGKEKAKASLSEGDKLKAEVAKVQADLKKMTRQAGSPDAESSKGKKAKESGAALLAAERAKYQKGGRSVGKGGKKRREEDDDVMSALDGFRSKIRAAAVDDGEEPAAEESIDGYAGEILEEDGDDEGWLGHSLRFRKDATMDQHTIDEYEVIDPRTQNMTLEDAKRQEARLKRQSGAQGGSGRLGGAATAAAEKNVQRRDREGYGNRGRDRH